MNPRQDSRSTVCACVSKRRAPGRALDRDLARLQDPAPEMASSCNSRPSTHVAAGCRADTRRLDGGVVASLVDLNVARRCPGGLISRLLLPLRETRTHAEYLLLDAFP
jgi:hypothetical protein